MTLSAAPTARPADPEAPLTVPARKFVRVLERRGDGLVLFEFSIGWPELAVELMLPPAAFDEFCATHQVTWLESLEGAAAAPTTPEETDT